MTNLTLKCCDGQDYDIQQDFAKHRFGLIESYLDEFPDHVTIDVKVTSYDLACLLNKEEMKKISKIEDWQRLLNSAEYLQSSDQVKEDVHDVFGDYMHYEHHIDMILTYDAYTYDDYRRKIADPTYKNEAEIGVFNTFKQLWG